MYTFWTVLLSVQVLKYLMQGVLVVLACQDSLLCEPFFFPFFFGLQDSCPFLSTLLCDTCLLLWVLAISYKWLLIACVWLI